MVTFEPVGNFVIVKSLADDQEVSGIIISHTDQQHQKAEVVAVGPGKLVEGRPGERHPMQVKVGDVVLVNSLRCAPEELPLEIEGRFMLIPETDIATIIRE